MELRLPVKVICTRAPVSRSYYWSLENRVGGDPSADLLERLAVVLDTTTTYLLGRTQNVARTGAMSGVPTELASAAARLRLNGDETRFLAGFTWRGRRPRTESDWVFLAESIDRACH